MTVLRTTALLAFALVLVVIIYATIVPISLRPKTGQLHPERVLAFLALGATLIMAFPRTPWRVVVIVWSIACCLEWIQTFVPTRDGRLSDALEKSCGATFGVAVGWVLELVIRRWRLASAGSSRARC